MKINFVSAAALAVATLPTPSCYAFVPIIHHNDHHSSFSAKVTRSWTLGSSAISAIPTKTTTSSSSSSKLPNPYQNLPWVTEREEKRKQRRLIRENAALFRELGLPEDATYEDVAAKTKHLIALAEES